MRMVRRLAAALLCCLPMVPGHAGAADKPMTIYFFLRPPYYTLAEPGKPSGFLMEITRLVLNEAGIPQRYVRLPPKRILGRLQGKEYAGSPGWFRTPEREAYARFSLPIYRNRPLCLVTNRKLAPKFGETPKMAQILASGLTLGVIDGFSYGRWADEQIARFEPNTYSFAGNQENLIEMVLRNRLGYMFMSTEEAVYRLGHDRRAADLGQLIRIADAPEGNQRHLMFSLGVDAGTVARIDAAIERVKRSAAYEKIVGDPERF